MTIKKLYIGHFGSLKNVEIELKNGFNIIYGENESGKSTLQTFIKSMFYGMNSQKKDIKENPRLHYIPWGEQNAHGELCFSDEYNNDYIIKRAFGRKKREDESEVFNLITGEIAPHISQEKPGESVFGLGEEAFERTVWIKQLGVGVYPGKDDELIRRLANLHETGDENTSYQKALEGLNEARKQISNQRRSGKLDKLKLDYQNFVEELRLSTEKFQDAIEDEIAIRSLVQKRNMLKKKLENLELSRKERKDYEYWIRLKDEVDTTKKEMDDISKELEALKVSIDEFKGFEGLNEEKIHQLINAIGEKKLLEKELIEYERILKEIQFLKDQLNTYHNSLKEIKKYGQVDKAMELEINKLESHIRELEYKFDQSGKKEGLIIRMDILMDKNRTFMALWVLGIIMVLGGLTGGFLFHKFLYAFVLMGTILLVWSTNGKKKNLSKLKEVQRGIDEIENSRINEERDKAKNDLKKIYATLEVENYQEFIEGLGSYQDKQSKLNELKIKVQEKEEGLKRFDVERLKEKLADITKFVVTSFNLYGCESVQELNSKFRDYKELRFEQKSLEKDLVKLNDTLILHIDSVKKFEVEISKNFFEKGEPPREEEITDLMAKIHDELILVEKQLKDREHSLEIRFLNNRQPMVVQEEITYIKGKILQYEKYLKSIDISFEVIQEAFQEMQRNFGPRLNKRASDVLEKITNGKYDELKISENYEVKVMDPIANGIRSMDYFSNGTWDQIYFSLRMGLIDLLLQKDNIPILLDDAFLQYDNTRLEKTLEYLYKINRQIVLFTCQKRELEILKDHDEVNFIYL